MPTGQEGRRYTACEVCLFPKKEQCGSATGQNDRRAAYFIRVLLAASFLIAEGKTGINEDAGPDEGQAPELLPGDGLAEDQTADNAQRGTDVLTDADGHELQSAHADRVEQHRKACYDAAAQQEQRAQRREFCKAARTAAEDQQICQHKRRGQKDLHAGADDGIDRETLFDGGIDGEGI